MQKTKDATLGIPTYKEFMALQQADRNAVLLDLLKHHADKDIREVWDLKYNTFYNHKSRAMKSAPHTDGGTGPSMGAPASTPAPDSVTEGDDRRVIIDADYEVIVDDKDRHLPAVIEEKENGEKVVKVELPVLNLSDIVATPEDLDKQLQAVQTLMSVMSGKDAKYRINLQVYKV